MTALLNQIRLFRWRAASYFFAGLFTTLGGALSTSTADTSWRGWGVAAIIALGAAWVNLKAFLDEAANQKPPPQPPPADSTP